MNAVNASGAKTGEVPCVADCNGDLDGDAFVDECGNRKEPLVGRNARFHAMVTSVVMHLSMSVENVCLETLG